MATILKNILSFTGLVVGVPVALPHRLNVNGIPALPRTVEPDVGGFTVTANSTAVTVTRTADAASGNVNVLVEFWHSIEAVVPLVPPPGQLIGQVPWVQQPGTGGGGGGTNFVYTYQPGGGQAGPFVFDNFTALYGALNAARLSAQGSAGFTLVFDNTSNPAMLVPAGAYDMEGVTWISVQWGRGRTTDHLVTFAEGVAITNLSTITGLRLSPDPAATTPPITLGIGPLQLIESTLAGAETQLCVVGIPGFSAEIVVDQYSTIGGDTTEAAVLVPNGQVLQVMLGGASALIDIFAFDDDGGTGTINVHIAEESSTYTQSQVHLTNLPAIRQECPFWHWSGDPNGVVDASADLDTRWLLVDDLTGTRWRNVTGGIWVLDVGAGGDSTCLIYKPGSGQTGPVIFDTWAGLYAQLTALRAAANGGGCYTIQFDNSTSALYSDASIPAGVWNMLDVSWEGTQIGNPIVGGTSVVVLEQGATFTNGPLNFRYLAVYGVATALPPPFTITNLWEQQIKLFKTFFVAFDPAVPIYLIDGTTEGQAGARFVVEHSEINQGVNPTFWALNNGYAGFILSPGAVIPANTFVTDGTGEFSWEFYASSANVSEDQPLAPGAALAIDDDVNNTYVRHFTNEVYTVDENAYSGYLNRFDASGAAPINAQLEQTIASFNRYQWALIKETSGQPSSNGAGDMGLTIQPFAGDTIDGVLGPKLLLPGAQTALISDGSGGWNSAYTTAGVPEKVFASVVIDSSGGLEKRIAFFNVGNATSGSGVVKNGTGDWTITFNNPFPVGYFPIVTFGFRDQGLVFGNYNTIDNSNMQILTYNAAGVLSDPNYINVVVHLAPEIID